MCIACIPGVNPVIFAVNVTLPFFSVKLAVPATVLLLFGSSVTAKVFASLDFVLVLQPIISAVIIAKETIIFFIK
jgi:hypothetical protein